mmetsp:Transcript_22744/g.56161  ORF Transcript_22744/g.56161 Transcript_22744/m.56161 type:complete len:160 (-) Transcript_22744:378-857(-)
MVVAATPVAVVSAEMPLKRKVGESCMESAEAVINPSGRPCHPACPPGEGSEKAELLADFLWREPIESGEAQPQEQPEGTGAAPSEDEDAASRQEVVGSIFRNLLGALCENESDDVLMRMESGEGPLQRRPSARPCAPALPSITEEELTELRQCYCSLIC